MTTFFVVVVAGFDFLLQVCTPSDQLCSTLLLPNPPQFLNQEPPGAQQLTLPDFANLPHVGHVVVSSIFEMTDAVVLDLTISSRSGTGR
jgi:hypothetical protein